MSEMTLAELRSEIEALLVEIMDNYGELIEKLDAELAAEMSRCRDVANASEPL